MLSHRSSYSVLECFKAWIIKPRFLHLNKALGMLITYIATFEKMCSIDEPSVIDYADNGIPIYSDINLSMNQSNKIKLLQSETLRFIKDAKSFFDDAHIHLSQQC